MRGRLAGKSGGDFGGTLGIDTSTNPRGYRRHSDIITVTFWSSGGKRISIVRESRDTLSSLSLDGSKSNAIHTHAHVHKIHEKRGHTRTRRTSEHDTTDNTRGRTKKGNDAVCGERIYDRGSTGRKREENEKNIYKRIYKKYIYISIYFYLL